MQPLNAAQLFASSLSQRLARKDEAFGYEREVLGHIDSSLRAAEQIISALLEISRLDTGTMQAHPRTVAVRPLMQQLGQEFSVLARAEGLTLHTVFSDLQVRTDEALLRRVLQNLLSNAVRYTERGRVLFGCRRRGDTLSIEIWDTGPGIPDDQQARVFHEFQRLPQLGRRQIKGLGLGLAIADRICRLLEHRISVRSWPGRGTVFAVSVPLVVGEPEVASPPEPAVSDQRDVAGLRVFCVDNDPALLASLEALLRALGCDPIVARSRADALEEARGRPAPDLLLVDYQLDDGETGFQVIDALDGCWEDVVPAMLITADRRAEVRVRAREQGVGFLQKPVSEAALLEVLRAL